MISLGGSNGRKTRGGNAGKQAGNAGKQLGNTAKQAGNSGKQLGNTAKQQAGNVGKQLENTAKQAGNAGKQLGNTAKQQAGNAGKQFGNVVNSPGNVQQQLGNVVKPPRNVQQQLGSALQPQNVSTPAVGGFTTRGSLPQIPITNMQPPQLSTANVVLRPRVPPVIGKIGGDISRESKQSFEDIGRESKVAGGNIAREGKQLGGDVAREAKDAGGDFARESKRFGGDVAREGKRFGGDIAREGKHLGGDIAREAKKVGGDLPENLKNARDDASQSIGETGGKASDWWKEHVNKPVGKPWNRGIRDPWVRYLTRIYNTGQDRLDKTDERYDTGVNDAASGAGDANTGDQFKYRDVPNGTVQESEYGKSVIAVDAPKGGQVGYDIPDYMEGKKVKITMWVRVDKGQAKIGLGDDDGNKIAFAEEGIVKQTETPKGEEWKLGFQEVSIVTDIPITDRARDGTDEAHDYRGVLQVDPGSKVHVAFVRIERAD